MTFQLKILEKLDSLEEANPIPKKMEEILDKLINIKKVSQFKELDLSDEDCDKIITHLEGIEVYFQINGSYIDKLKSAKPEYIPISFSDNFL